MSKILLLNADPAPEEWNYTDGYLATLSRALEKKAEVSTLKITQAQGNEIRSAVLAADKTVFAFPLCMDTLPPQLVQFFLQSEKLAGRAYGLISTDVLEYGHTDFAEPQLRLACEKPWDGLRLHHENRRRHPSCGQLLQGVSEYEAEKILQKPFCRTRTPMWVCRCRLESPILS